MTDQSEKAKMLRGELYYAFSPELVAARALCGQRCQALNNAPASLSRIERINLLNAIVGVPPVNEDTPSSVIDNAPWIETPFRADHGTNIELGDNVFINYGCVVLDTCKVKIGSRTLVGPNVSFYAATHPLDPDVRNGLQGPEMGAEIHIGEDCWIAGGVTILPGVKVGRGAVLGAASVVTKDVPDYAVVAGNPARIIKYVRSVEVNVEENKRQNDIKALTERLEALEKEMQGVKSQIKHILHQ